MKIALVTGGGGFLGSSIVRMLLDKGITVCSLQRSDNPDLKKLGVEIIRGDISDRDTVINAAEGCDVIFHVATKAKNYASARFGFSYPHLIRPFYCFLATMAFVHIPSMLAITVAVSNKLKHNTPQPHKKPHGLLWTCW